MCRIARTCKHDNGNDARLFRKRARSMAHSMRLVEPFALRLARRPIARFRLERNAYHHLHSLDRIGPCRCFRAQHDSICSIEYGIGNVAGFGACGTGIGNHRLEHLGRGNHGQPEFVAARNDTFLNERHLFWSHFDAQIATRHHYAICHFKYLVQARNRLWLLQFSNQRRRYRGLFATLLRQHLLHKTLRLQNILRPAHEAERHVIDALLQTKAQVFAVLLGESGSAYRYPRQVDTLMFFQHTTMHDLTPHLVGPSIQYTQFHQTIIEQNTVSRFDILRQLRIGRADYFGVSRDWTGSDSESVSIDQAYRLAAL